MSTSKLDIEELKILLDTQGYAVVPAVVPPPLLARLGDGLYRVRERIDEEVGRFRLERAREVGVLRLMMSFDPVFTELLELPVLLRLVDELLGNTAILHLQNGLLLPPSDAPAADVFQYRFHQDFPRYLNGYRASLNVMIAIDAFTEVNGATLVVPATHQREIPPSGDFCQRWALPMVCAAGDAIVFDSTLWHAAGVNRSGRDRLAINHQFTRSWIKQQIDYCRALDASLLASLPERSRQLLGYYTRVVASLDDYYQPTEQRLYRSGQG
ncbi:MAG: phytanoyl-CoA dioxygenase family protein [Pseudomonas oryzihabitans]